MPSPRRVRLLMLAAVLTFVFVLFYTSSFGPSDVSGTAAHDFYHKTKNAMEGAGAQKPGHISTDRDADGDVDDDDKKLAQKMQQRLKAAEQEAKDKANEKGGLRPDPPRAVIGVGGSAEGQLKDGVKIDGKKAAAKDAGKDAAAAKVGDKKVESKNGAAKVDATEEQKQPPSKEERDALNELGSILKKSPVVIFSKSYCPFSKRAKELLLHKYMITPEPYVVELDNHPLGQVLQDRLLEKTGRRTVPNILINGVSIGGADDITEMDNHNNLVKKIVSLGNKRVDMVLNSGRKE